MDFGCLHVVSHDSVQIKGDPLFLRVSQKKSPETQRGYGDGPRRGEAPAPHLKQAKPVPLGAGFDPSPLSTAASKLRFTFCGTRLWKRGPGPRSAVTPADGYADRLAPGTIVFPPCPRNRPPERPGPEPGGGWTRFWF